MTKIINVEVVPSGGGMSGEPEGWAVLCSVCGVTGGPAQSLRGMADQQAMNHRGWHAVQDANAKAEMQMAVASEVHHLLWRIANAMLETHDADALEDVGQMGNVLNVLLNPAHPEAQENLGAIRAGVDMFLNELRDN